MKNFLISVLVVAVIVLGYIAFKPKTEITISPTSVSPSGNTTTINNSNGQDYQPATPANKTVTDTELGINFAVKNNAEVSKGAARCCPNTYMLSTPMDSTRDSETLDRIVPGDGDDPGNGKWALAKPIGTKTFGTNVFNVYQITDSDKSTSYIFTITKDPWMYKVVSVYQTPKYIDLASVVIK